MTSREMEKLMQHLETHFQQTDCTVLHPEGMNPHIDVLIYKPSTAVPYWKLITMGASDHRMPAPKGALGDRNEYMMFIDSDENLTDKSILNQYVYYLMEVAHYPISTQSYISYGHSMEWTPDEGEEMVGAYLEMPQLIKDPSILRCKLGLFKTAVCLQIVLLTRAEIDKLLAMGSEQFSYFLYPENGDNCHFLCELRRSEKF